MSSFFWPSPLWRKRLALSLKPNVKTKCWLLSPPKPHATQDHVVTLKGGLLWHSNGLNDSFSKSGLEKINHTSRCHYNAKLLCFSALVRERSSPLQQWAQADSSAAGWHCHTVAASCKQERTGKPQLKHTVQYTGDGC